MSDSATSPHHRRIPALRPVELLPAEQDGESLIVLSDRQGIATDPIVLHASILPFLQLFDGQHTVLDLQTALTRAAGQIISSADVEDFVDRFDTALMLDTDRFRHAAAGVVSAFRDDSHRRPSHADRVYPGEAVALRQLLDRYKREHADGVEPVPRSRVSALIAPHIDYERGARCYARAYQCLEDVPGAGDAATGAAEPDVYVLLGTAHSGLQGLYSFLGKSFETPLGELPVDYQVADALEQRFGRPSDHDILAHRAEHSLELTATYLAYALGGRPARILPILCGVGYMELGEGGEPAREAIGRYLDALRETLAQHERRPCYVVGADLAHVGPRFGDEAPVTDSFLAEVESADRRSLEAALTGSAEEFARAVVDAQDRYRVCGLGAIYSVLRLLDGDGGAVRGELIDYGQATDPDGSQSVTYAGLLYRRDD